MDDIERFWSKVDTSAGPDECWPWTGGRNKQGYGRFYTSERAGAFNAHRWLLGHLRGRPLISVPRGLEDGCHRCDNPPCCNPAHLYVGTRKQNVGDAVERSRLWMLQRTHCPQGHELQPKPGQNRRYCPPCARAGDKRRRSGRTHCKNGHELAGDNLLLCKNGTRKCRICDAERVRKVHAPRG